MQEHSPRFVLKQIQAGFPSLAAKVLRQAGSLLVGISLALTFASLYFPLMLIPSIICSFSFVLHRIL